jgi:hypothetical protein
VHIRELPAHARYSHLQHDFHEKTLLARHASMVLDWNLESTDTEVDPPYKTGKRLLPRRTSTIRVVSVQSTQPDDRLTKSQHRRPLALVVDAVDCPCRRDESFWQLTVGSFE